jgi:glc operon protein GlcG
MPKPLSLQDAQRMALVAIAESERRGVQTAVAVVDARGDLIMVARLDGARHYYPDVAYGKAMGSAMWDETSRVLSQRSSSNSVQQRVNRLNGDRLVFAPGAVPLHRDGALIGAIGVGGSGPDSDEEIAMLAAQSLDVPPSSGA